MLQLTSLAMVRYIMSLYQGLDHRASKCKHTCRYSSLGVGAGKVSHMTLLWPTTYDLWPMTYGLDPRASKCYHLYRCCSLGAGPGVGKVSHMTAMASDLWP